MPQPEGAAPVRGTVPGAAEEKERTVASYASTSKASAGK